MDQISNVWEVFGSDRGEEIQGHRFDQVAEDGDQALAISGEAASGGGNFDEAM